MFVNRLQLGVIGTGLAGTFTNLFILTVNYIYTTYQEDLKEATNVSFWDPQVFRQLGVYTSIALPNFIIIFLDWSCFEVMTLISGYIGVN